jgi:hypothetical protein
VGGGIIVGMGKMDMQYIYDQNESKLNTTMKTKNEG